jgi:hypothetical protein
MMPRGEMNLVRTRRMDVAVFSPSLCYCESRWWCRKYRLGENFAWERKAGCRYQHLVNFDCIVQDAKTKNSG